MIGLVVPALASLHDGVELGRRGVRCVVATLVAHGTRQGQPAACAPEAPYLRRRGVWGSR